MKLNLHSWQQISLPVALTAISLGALSSCQDYDAGFTEGEVKKQQYARDFEKVFGNIDPEQDWSMAQQITANVSGLNDGLMEVYYSCPIGKDPIILAYANVTGGQCSFKFDVTKGTKQVYVRVGDGNGNYSFKGYFDIVDGELVISNEGTRAKRYDIADPTDPCNATKSEAQTLSCSQLLDHSQDDLMEIKPYESLSSTEQLGYIDGKHYSKSTGQGITTDFLHTDNFTNVYNVYNVLSFDERPWWYVGDVAHYFEDIDGEKGVFKEFENHVVLMKDGAVPHLEKDLVFEIAEGGGSFYLDYFFKGTKYDNQFGYFYFTGDIPTYTQFMSMNKYVLINDMSHKDYPQNTPEDVKGVQITETTKRPWDLLCNLAPGATTPGVDVNGLSYAESNWDTKIIGTRIPFVYWGADGNTPSYTFPAGTKIGLFFIGNVNDARDNLIITSISKLNLDLYDETPHAASFKYDGEVVFAMEDMRWGGDKDVNDAMFIASGNFKKDPIPEIRPVTPQGQTWIMACEDLGGTFDYDFNDLVFGIRKTPQSNGTTSDLYFVPLASGGTLDAKVYYNDGSEDKLIGEMHNLVKAGASTSEPLNVTAGSTPFEGNPVRIGEIANDVSVNTIAAKFKIVVTRSDETKGEADSDDINIGFAKGDIYKAPQVLLLPSGWDWPSENTPITEVYPKFKDWVKNGSVVAWCAKSEIKAGSSFVYDPVAKAPVQADPGSAEDTPSTPSNPGESGGGSVTPTPTDGIWNITLSGETANAETNTAYVEKGKSIELGINVEGVDDLSTLNISCQSYSETTYITVPAYSGDGKVHITGNAVGSARVAVVIEGDDDHQKTRKEFLIVVTDRMPEFSLNIGGTTVDEENSYRVLIGDPIQNLNIVIPDGYGDGNCIRVISSDPSTASVDGAANFNQHNISTHKTGDVDITVRHIAAAGSWAQKDITFKLNVVEGNGTNENPCVCNNTTLNKNLGDNPMEFQSLVYLDPYDAPYNRYYRLTGEVVSGDDVVAVEGKSFKIIGLGTAIVKIVAHADDTYAAKEFNITINVAKKDLNINAASFMVKAGGSVQNFYNVPGDYTGGTISGSSDLGTVSGTTFTAGNESGTGTITLSCTETDIYAAKDNCGQISVTVYSDLTEETITENFGNLEASLFEGAMKVEIIITASAEGTYYQFHSTNGWEHDYNLAIGNWQLNQPISFTIDGDDLTTIATSGINMLKSDGLTEVTYKIYK